MTEDSGMRLLLGGTCSRRPQSCRLPFIGRLSEQATRGRLRAEAGRGDDSAFCSRAYDKGPPSAACG